MGESGCLKIANFRPENSNIPDFLVRIWKSPRAHFTFLPYPGKRIRKCTSIGDDSFFLILEILTCVLQGCFIKPARPGNCDSIRIIF